MRRCSGTSRSSRGGSISSLHRLVRLETELVRVHRDASAASWRVVYSRKLSGAVSEEVEDEVFDAVVVCNGHYTEPRLASIAGMYVCARAIGYTC
jgi:cation diffusion facilitator CzcD-associated flavoprotein CzcO